MRQAQVVQGEQASDAKQGPAGLVPYNPNAIRDRAELVVGKFVKHRVFGTGAIANLDDDRIHIRFGTKEKALSLAACLEMGLLEPV
jgi:DNA helicase-2/ATP-dependent DNA helicase PcrA